MKIYQQLLEKELTTKARKKIPKKEFALDVGGEEKYPVEDKAHAANAKARATQQKKKGNLTQSQYNTINAKANRVLGEDSAAETAMYHRGEALSHWENAKEHAEGTHWNNVALLKHHNHAQQYHEVMAKYGRGVDKIKFHTEQAEKHAAMHHRFKGLVQKGQRG